MQVFLNDDGSEMELGRGGFGVVLRGTYRMAPVAIKRLKDQSLEQQEVFMREMALLRGCRGSRYIVPFVGASLQPVRLLSESQDHLSRASNPTDVQIVDLTCLT